MQREGARKLELRVKSLLFKPRLPDDHRLNELKKLKDALNGRPSGPQSAARTADQKEPGTHE